MDDATRQTLAASADAIVATILDAATPDITDPAVWAVPPGIAASTLSAMIADSLSVAYAEGERAGMEQAATLALEERCERGIPWDLACTTIADKIRQAAGEVTGG